MASPETHRLSDQAGQPAEIGYLESMRSLPKLLVLLGPTATGKSDLGVELALEFNGEVISADSRQVYKNLDLGTGKILPSEMAGVPHHLLDIAEPEQQISSITWKQKAEQVITEILARDRKPILVGGTGFYIQTLTENVILPDARPSPELRRKLEKMTTEDLNEKIKAQDPKRAETIDPKNRRRLVRALEIIDTLGAVPKIKTGEKKYHTLKIGLDRPDEELKTRIKNRLKKRIDQGLITEGENLKKAGLSDTRMEELGLEYRYLSRYLNGEISRNEMTEKIETTSWQYAKRQRSWFRRDRSIVWFDPENQTKIKQAVQEFFQSA